MKGSTNVNEEESTTTSQLRGSRRGVNKSLLVKGSTNDNDSKELVPETWQQISNWAILQQADIP